LLGNKDPEAKNPWEIFMQVASESEGREYSKRLAVAGYALSCCPADKIESVLELWRSLEMESVHAPVEVDPRRGVAGFMSTMIERTSSASSGMSASGLGYGPGYNPGNAVTSSGALGGGGGPLAEIIRAGTNKSSNSSRSGTMQREQTMGNQHEEGGRKRDKLKSLVNSIWAQ
jgi:hypothetical protein